MARRKTWKSLFTQPQIKAGEALYRMGKVKKLIAEDDGYSVVVRDDRNYNVFVEASYDNDIYDLSCDCALGMEGERCRHMAGACFLITSEYGELYPAEALVRENEEKAENDSKAAQQKNGKAGGVKSSEAEIPSPPSAAELKELDQLQSQGHQELMTVASEEGSAYAPDEYRYFHGDKLLDGLNISATVLKKAHQLIRDEKCSSIRIRLGFENKVSSEQQLCEGTITGTESFYYGWTAKVTVNARKVVAASCTSFSCYHRVDKKSSLGFELCEHEAAAVLLMQDYLKDHDPGDTTNMAGMRLLSSMAWEQNSSLTGKPGEMLTLEPYLVFDELHRIRASFRIGAGKLFKIKNIPRTVENIREHKEESFGKNTTLQLGEEYLSEVSVPVLRFLEDILKEDEEINQRLSGARGSYYGSPTLPSITGDIELKGDRLDRFFEMEEGRRVEAQVKDNNGYASGKVMLLFADRDIHPQFEIHKDVDAKTGVFHGIVLSGDMPELYPGRKCAYYLEDAGFYRMSGERYQMLAPLADSSYGGYVRIQIGRNYLSDFYYKTLPKIKDAVDLVEYDDEIIAKYLPPEPSFVCYLDYLEDAVICRAEAAYGVQIFSLTDLLDQEQSQGKNLALFRDIQAEGRVLNVILKYLMTYDVQNSILVGKREEEQVFEFLSYGLQELMDVAEVRATERFKRLRVRKSVVFSVGVAVESNLMDLSVLSEELSEEELLDALYMYRQKHRYMRLKNGDFLKLDQNETIAQLSRMLETLRIPLKEFVKGKMQIPAYRALYLDKMLESAQDIYARRDSHFRKLVKEFKAVEDADYEIPEGLHGVLRKYQEVGYRWLRTLDHYGFGGILADEMGLGKTLQVITVMLAVCQEEKEKNPSLVVCPASLVYNWGEELHRFAPELKVALLAGTQKERAVMLEGYQEADVLVTSYDLLKRDIAEYDGKTFRFQIIDEAQYIKNHGTAAAKSVKLIKAQTKFALTGTPIENRLSELWSIFDYLMPGFLYEYETFRTNMETPIVKHQEEEVQAQLRRMVTPFILRRKKEDVLADLPEKLEEIRYAKMEKKQQKLYDGQVVKMKSKIAGQDEESFRRSKIEILAELMRIRQICCDPNLIYEDYNGGSAKTDACMELLQSLTDSGHKTLVFSQFTSMLAILEEQLREADIPFFKITGETPKERRINLVKKFNEDETPVFLISLKAGGTGLNLVGADVVIHFDPWWNLAVQNQATDRAHRIGQTRIVTVYKLIMKDTIEEKIVQMQESKKKLAEDILSGEGIGSGALNREELMALLE